MLAVGDALTTASFINQKLKEAGLYGRKSAKKPLIPAKNRAAREHGNWINGQ